MQVCVLGPLLVRDGEVEVPIGGPQHRRILARLALESGASVSADTLEFALWQDDPPPTARHTIASRVFQLRSRGVAIDTTPEGYALRDPTDATTLVRLLEAERASTDPAGSGPHDGTAGADRIRGALVLWRGRPYADLDGVPEAEAEAARLTDLVDAARESLLEYDLATGDLTAAVAEARRLTSEQPYRERRWELLMLGLYRAGRQADALATYAEARRVLLDDLDIEPGPGLRRMQQAVISQDPALDRPAARDVSGEATQPETRPPRLPGTATRLIGRARERQELGDVWARARLATIVGPPGAGKTRLAIEAARSESGPVWYVALEPLADDQAVAAAILGVVAPASRAADAAAGVRDALADAEGLLLLDGCEGRRAEAATEVSRLLIDCPGLRVLATSRERLGLAGEALIPVGGLSAADALALLVDRAQLSDPSFRLGPAERPDAARLCALVDGLPLAVELVARHLPMLSIPEVTDRVAADLGRWAGGSTDGRSGIWAALAGSVARLTATEQRVLLALAVMSAASDLELIAEVAGPGEVAGPVEVVRGPFTVDEAFDEVARLVDASLVQVRSDAGRTRYEVLQTIARFTRESATTADLVGAEDRYRAAVVGRTSTHAARLTGPDRAEALGQLDRDMAHARAVLLALTAPPVDHEQVRDGLRLAIALTDYWLSRRPAEGLDVIGRLVQAADPPRDLLAEARLRQAHLAYWVASFADGLRYADEAQTLFAELGDPLGEGRALRRIGAIAAATDDVDAARAALEASLRQLDLAGADDEVGTTLLHLGSLLADEAAVSEALPILERARAIAQRRDDPLAVGLVLAALNLVHWKAGELTAAIAAGDEALDIFRRVGHRPTEATVAYRLSAVARGLERPLASRRYAELAIEAGEQIQTRTSVALGHVDLARLDLDEDRIDDAAGHLTHALDLHDPRADRWVLVEVLEAIARLLAATGRDGGRPLLDAARSIRVAIRQPVAPTEAADLAWTRARSSRTAARSAARSPAWPGGGEPLDPSQAYALAREVLGTVEPAPDRPALRVLRGSA